MSLAATTGDAPRGLLSSEAGPAPKRIVVAYGFWIFLLSDVVMFSSLFAAYAVLLHATAGGPTGVQLFSQVSVAVETACLLASSYTCGLMSLAIGRHHRLGTYGAAAATFVLGAAFVALEVREFAGMIARGATPQTSGFLSAFFTLVGCHGLHVTAGLVWLVVMMAQVGRPGLSRRRPATPAVLFPVLACARHHLGLAVHGCLPDGSSPMTDTSYDRAPGDQPTPTATEERASSGVLVYTIGLLLSVALTATSFWAANTSLLWGPGVPLGLAVLAVAQMGIHLVFFLHITTGPDNTNNVLALAFGILIVILVVAGSLWIMANLNDNMMLPAELMNPHMQR
jgi:cytochrome o ubiquinol oxidase subunit 3